MESHKSHVPNHQPDEILVNNEWLLSPLDRFHVFYDQNQGVPLKKCFLDAGNRLSQEELGLKNGTKARDGLGV